MSPVWSSAGYWVCSHQGCSKKAREHEDHDCCGRHTHEQEKRQGKAP